MQTQAEKEKQVMQLHRNVNALKGNLEKAQMLSDLKAKNQLTDNEHLLKEVNDMRHEIRQLSTDNYKLKIDLYEAQRKKKTRVILSSTFPNKLKNKNSLPNWENFPNETENENDSESENFDEMKNYTDGKQLQSTGEEIYLNSNLNTNSNLSKNMKGAGRQKQGQGLGQGQGQGQREYKEIGWDDIHDNPTPTRGTTPITDTAATTATGGFSVGGGASGGNGSSRGGGGSGGNEAAASQGQGVGGGGAGVGADQTVGSVSVTATMSADDKISALMSLNDSVIKAENSSINVFEKNKKVLLRDNNVGQISPQDILSFHQQKGTDKSIEKESESGRVREREMVREREKDREMIDDKEKESLREREKEKDVDKYAIDGKISLHSISASTEGDSIGNNSEYQNEYLNQLRKQPLGGGPGIGTGTGVKTAMSNHSPMKVSTTTLQLPAVKKLSKSMKGKGR